MSGIAEKVQPVEGPPGEAPPVRPAARDRFRLPGSASWIAALVGGVGGIGYLGYLRGRYQHSNVFLPDRFPEGVWDPCGQGLATEDVWFRAADGVALHGWWIAHPRPAGTLLYCHGSSGSIAQRIGIFRQLAKLRLNVFAFDYRGYGRSEGVPSERGLYADARAAHDHLVDVRGASGADIVLFGHSLGGAVAIEVARDRAAAGLVVQSTFTDLKDMARAHHPQLPLHWITRNQFRSIEKVAELDLPKLFIHGTDDDTVPLAVGRRLFDSAAPPKELYLVERAGHNDLHVHGGAAYIRRLVRFRKACLST
ncbi:MAG TPA: alpha/beta hydrolase [Thermoanaerobaculia bacterium]|nr:alpha/beta hydrolase [Thermoanaerobaculia bacterium]